MDELKAIFRSILEQEFRDVEIKEVSIREPDVFQDEDMIYVTVVFKTSGRLDRKARLGFVRHVRPKLAEVDEHRFPVMSFIADEEYRSQAS